MIYPFALQTDINLHDNSRTYRNPSNETCNPISINKHLLGSLTQQQTYSDIQLCCNWVQALCSQTTEDCKKQKQEMRIIMKLRDLKIFVLISLKRIQHLHTKIQKRTPRHDCTIIILQKRYIMLLITESD